jgi:hypothetical protein
MKTQTIITILTTLTLTLTSCEEFLRETNKSGLTSDPFYTTPEGVESLVNACYTPLRYWYGREEASNFTATGTDIVTKGAGHTNTPVNDYSTDFKADNGGLNNLWSWEYKAINFCNTALACLEDVEMDNKDVLKGEVSFLRAFYYWHVAEMWGKTHFTTEASEGVITTASATEVSVIYDQIFADLDLAIANCPEEKERGGRITCWAAKAFKARMLLTRGEGKAAATLAKEVIAGPFELFDDYKALWDMSNSEGSTNSEVIWYVNYASNHLLNLELDNTAQIRSGGNNLHLMYAMKYDNQPGMTRDIENGRPFNRYMPTRYMLELMDQANDQRWAGSFKWIWTMNAPDNRGDEYPNMTDTAIWTMNGYATAEQRAWAKGRYQIFDLDDVYEADGSVKNRKQYVQIDKFSDPARTSKNEDRSSRDAFVMRISEMYLIVAEGLMDSNPSEALDYLNRLRRKRAIPGHEAAMAVTADALNIDFILDERAREFIGEQLRWFDLKRTGKLVERVKAHNPDGTANINSGHLLRPYPQDFLDAITNKEDFPQREDY